jgi:hypothetical protein
MQAPSLKKSTGLFFNARPSQGGDNSLDLTYFVLETKCHQIFFGKRVSFWRMRREGELIIPQSGIADKQTFKKEVSNTV